MRKFFYPKIDENECVQCKTKQIIRYNSCGFWGLGKLIPEFNDNLGTSLVLIHTERGEKCF